MEKFLSIILSIILVVYLMGLIGKWLLRRWIYKKQKEFETRFGNPGGFRQYTWTSGGAGGNASGGNAKPSSAEGDVKVQYTERSEKKVSGNVGDYVDYEEVGKE